MPITCFHQFLNFLQNIIGRPDFTVTAIAFGPPKSSFDDLSISEEPFELTLRGAHFSERSTLFAEQDLDLHIDLKNLCEDSAYLTALEFRINLGFSLSIL